jgi:hypothetical protein
MRALTLGVLAAIVLAASNMSAKANLVVNGNFATGDFAGWTNPSGSGVTIDTTFAAPGDTYDAAFTGSGTLSQAISTTTGGSYMLFFSVYDESALASDTFTVTFGNFSDTITGLEALGAYASESLTIPAADVVSTSTELSFQAVDGSQDWNLDDVSLVQEGSAPIPEPASGALIVGGLALTAVRRRKSITRRG